MFATPQMRICLALVDDGDTVEWTLVRIRLTRPQQPRL